MYLKPKIYAKNWNTFCTFERSRLKQKILQRFSDTKNAQNPCRPARPRTRPRAAARRRRCSRRKPRQLHAKMMTRGGPNQPTKILFHSSSTKCIDVCNLLEIRKHSRKKGEKDSRHFVSPNSTKKRLNRLAPGIFRGCRGLNTPDNSVKNFVEK